MAMTADEKVARVHLEWTKDYQFSATFPDLPGVDALALDEAPPLGQGAGPNPAALLAAAVGNCLAASLAFCLRKSRATVDHISVDAAARIVRNDAGRFRISGVDVSLSPAVSKDDLDRLTRCDGLFEDFCIVTQSVRNGIPISVSLNGTPEVVGTATASEVR